MTPLNQGASSGELLALAERVATATGPDRELDVALHVAVTTFQPRAGGVGWPRGTIVVPAFPGWKPLPSYSSSIDAAMSLVPGGWRPAGSETMHGDFYAHLITRELNNEGAKAHAEASAITFPLAIVSAALKARAAQGGE